MSGRQRGWPVIGLLLLSAILYSSLTASGEDADVTRCGLSQISLPDLKRHVNTLACDAFEGREAGTRGGKAALAYLRSELKTLREIVSLPREQTQEFGREYQNLLLLLPGSDEALKQEVIVVGAHYDHVGYGKPSNSNGPFGQIHNGADDNASGAAALLELIKAFSSLDNPLPRSVLFAFWDAEEAGLLGSKHWVAHPTIPLKDIRFTLNIDMLGRLRDDRVVTVGWRSAPGLRWLLASNNVNGQLNLAFQPRVNADSDHHSFYSAGIPVIHLDTDKHADYHRPSDDPEKLNWDGLLLLTQFAFRVTFDAASQPDFPRFRREATKESTPAWMTTRAAVQPPVRLGFNWDSELAKRDIVQVTQLTPESPSTSAGLRIGDRIIQMGPWMNGTFGDFKTTMQTVKNPVSIRVQRSGADTPIELTATLWGSPVRLGAGWIDDPALPNCAVITHVVAESPADRAGIAAGDVVLQMGGRSIASSEEMRLRVLEEQGPFLFRIERQGRIREVNVELYDRPLTNAETTRVP